MNTHLPLRQIKSISTLLLLAVSIGNLKAQDGVLIDYTGNTRDNSAVLDVRSANQGVMVPRVALTATNNSSPVTSPATSLLIYNTATSGSGSTAVQPGYYYWNGTGWTRLMNGNASVPTGSGTTDYLARWTPNGTTLGTGATRDNGTNVGIGTAPVAGRRLTVDGDILANGGSFITSNASTGNIDHIWNDDGDNSGTGNTSGTWNFVNDLAEGSLGNAGIRAGNIYMANSGYVNYLAGDVGIGVAAPSQQLEVEGNIALDNYSIISAGGSSVDFGNTGIGNETDDIGINVASDGELEVNRNSISKISVGDDVELVRGSGNVAIGSNTATAKLDVSGDARIRNLGAGYVKSNANGNLSSGSIVVGDLPTHTHLWSQVTSKPAGWLDGSNLIETLTDFNASEPSGFYQGNNAANDPGTAAWYNMINVRHSSTSNDHGFQIAASYYDENVYTRTYRNGTSNNDGIFTAWQTLLSTANAASLFPNINGDNLGNHTATTNLNMNDRQVQNTLAIQGKDWDDNTGGTDDKYRLLYREGAHAFYNGGVVVGAYGNGTWTDLADGRLIVKDRIGVGTTNPTVKLHVASTDSKLIVEDGASNNAYIELDAGNAGSPQIGLSDKNGDMYWAVGGDDASNDFKIAGTTTGGIPVLNSNTSADVKLTIETGGNVGIGTTTPDAKLDVEGDFRVTGANSKVEFNTKESNNGWTLLYRDDFESSNDGWAMYAGNTSSYSSTAYFDRESFGVIGTSTCLNNYGKTSNAYVFKKEYDMTGVTWTEAEIKFDYLFIDSWDGRERGYAGVQNTLTGNPNILWTEAYDGDDNTQNRINYNWGEQVAITIALNQACFILETMLEATTSFLCLALH